MKRGTWLLALALALYILGVAIQVRYDRRSMREVFEPGSVFNTSDEGLSLAYGYLRAQAARAKSGASVETLHRRLDPEVLPARAVVFRVQPSVAPLLLLEEEVEEEEKDEGEKDGKDSKDDKDGEKAEEAEPEVAERPAPLLTDSEEAWVRGGGRLVLAVAESYGPLGLDPIQGKTTMRKVFPLWPGVSRLAPEKPAALAGPPLASGHALFLVGEGPVVSRLSIGTGEVFLLSIPEVFSNERLGQAQHLAFLESLAGINEGRPVLFDERAHGLGETAGLFETLGSWGLGPLVLLAGLTAATALWRAALRIGPPERDDRDTRSEAVELLDSLADLYDRALGRGDAIRLYHESFVHAVAAETGLRGPALEARVRGLLDASGGFDPPAAGEDLPRDRFERALRALNQAFRRLQDAKRK
jgi:hypothetical protein